MEQNYLLLIVSECGLKKSAEISDSGNLTITSDVLVPIGKLAASIPFNLLRNSRPISSIVNPSAWPCGVSSKINSSFPYGKSSSTDVTSGNLREISVFNFSAAALRI